jgi:hypothetical protein
MQKDLVQDRSANTAALAARKASVDCFLPAQESDSAKRKTYISRQLNAQRAQCGKPVGHDSLSACFVDRWPRTVGERDRKACSTSCDRGRKSRRSSTDDEYF